MSYEHQTTRTVKRVVITTALVVAAYVAGTLAPRASALDSIGTVTSELRGIRDELGQIRRALERHK